MKGNVSLAVRNLAPTSGTSVYEAWVIASDGDLLARQIAAFAEPVGGLIGDRQHRKGRHLHVAWMEHPRLRALGDDAGEHGPTDRAIHDPSPKRAQGVVDRGNDQGDVDRRAARADPSIGRSLPARRQ